MKVKNFMNNILHVNSDKTIAELARIMNDKNTGSVLVTDNAGEILGILTERDILKKVVAKGIDPSQTRVSRIMSSPLVTIDSAESIEKANRMMDEKNIRRLAVTEKGRIVGKVTAHGIARKVRYSAGQKVVSAFKKEYSRPF